MPICNNDSYPSLGELRLSELPSCLVQVQVQVALAKYCLCVCHYVMSFLWIPSFNSHHLLFSASPGVGGMASTCAS